MTASLSHDRQYASEICTVVSGFAATFETYILYPYGTSGEAMTATPTMITQETIQISQKRFHMAGHSLKKCDSSTSLIVDAHCML